MKQYDVEMTMLVSVTVTVDAENEKQAEQLAMEKTAGEEAYYLSRYESVLEREVTDVTESESDDDTAPELESALEYVRIELSLDDLTIIRAKVSKNLDTRMPASTGIDDCRVIDLLEEYGQEHDLGESWWEEYAEIDDILMKL